MQSSKKILLGAIFGGLLFFCASFSAQAAATISGKLTDTNGKPVHGLTVDALLNSGNVFSDTSNTNGEYSILVDDPTPITSGDYILRVQGFDIASDSSSTIHFVYYGTTPQQRLVTLKNLDNIPNINFTVYQHGMITGKVVHINANNKTIPILGAQMHFQNIMNSNLSVTEGSNESGNYYATPPYHLDDILFLIGLTGNNFADNTEGNYRGYVTAPGYLPYLIPEVKVKNDVTNTLKDVKLIRKSHAKGVIKNTNNKKLANILVQAYKIGETTPFASALSGIHGRYNIELGKTGSYNDFGDFSAVGDYTIIAGGNPDSNFGAGVRQVTITRDQTTLNNVNFSLPARNKKLSGKITNNQGKALKGARVQVNLLSNPSVASFAYTNAKGKYNIKHLVSGAYQMTVTKSGYADVIVSSQNISSHVSKSFQLQPAGVISGFVLNRFGNAPLSGIIVRLAGSELTGVTNASGFYKIANVSAGVHKVFIKDDAFAEQISGNISVTKNSDIRNIDFHLTSFARSIK